MVQEFHVLRCFSCQTFQVQQVKTSKKWSCKMCGEKQSLIKEYGRGTGADCRRHVQKLNTLRGEVENERAWTQWEDEENEDEEDGDEEEEVQVQDDPGDESHSSEQKDEAPHLSRWSKYVVQTDNEPKSGEEEEEEENVYTERQWCRRRNNFSGKRKISFSSKAACGYTAHEEEEDDTRCRNKKPAFQTQHRDGALKSSPEVRPLSKPSGMCSKTSALYDSRAASHNCNSISTSTGARPQSSAELNAKRQPSLPSVPRQRPSESTPGSKDSKWAMFLNRVEEDEDEDDDCGQHAIGADAGVIDGATGPVRPTTQSSASIFDKLTRCVSGSLSTQPRSPTFASSGSFQKPVCVQPPPLKKTQPSVSFNTFFRTDEDFDDAY